jgi:hypothetical protein
VTLFQRTPQLNISNSEQLRETIHHYFHNTFNRYDQLFETLACDEAYYKKPISLRHPLDFLFRPHRYFFYQ